MGIQFNGNTDTISTNDGTLNVNPQTTFGGEVGIAGTLTYEDVTNIDSVGIITARSGIRVGVNGTKRETVHLDAGDSGANYLRFTNTTTGNGTADGFNVGINADEEALIWNFENKPTIFATGNSERLLITSDGNIEIDSFNSPSTRTLSLRTTYLANANGGIGLAAKDHSGSAADGLGIYGTDGVSIHTANAGTVYERLRIDTNGALLLSTAGTRRNTKGSSQFQAFLIEGTTNDTTRMSMIRSSNDDNGPEIQIIKTRGTSVGSVTKPNQNDYIGSLTFIGADDSDLYSRGAEISVQATGTPANDRCPSDIMFSTTPTSGASTPQERLRIASDGNIGVNQTSPQALLHIGNYETTQNVDQSSVTQYFIDSTKSLKIARCDRGSISSAGWYDVAVLANRGYS